MNESISPVQGTGYLIIQVTTAGSAIPLSGAAVRITQSDGERFTVLYDLTSGEDGRTERVALTAPARSLSLTPSTQKTYAAYGIEVSLDGYERVMFEDVPIFDGITSIQQAILIPLPEAGYTDDLTKNSPRKGSGDTAYGL